MSSISAVFKGPERSGYVQVCEAPGKGSAPGNVASPGSVSSSSNVMSSEGYGSLSAGHVCSPGNIVSPPSQSDWKATSNQVAAHALQWGCPESECTFNKETEADGFMPHSPAQDNAVLDAANKMTAAYKKIHARSVEELGTARAEQKRQHVNKLLHGQQHVIVCGGAGSYGSPPKRIVDCSPNHIGSSPTKPIHTMSPAELKGEAMVLSSMQACDEVEAEHRTPLAGGSDAVDEINSWLSSHELAAVKGGDELCKRLFEQEDFQIIKLDQGEQNNECFGCEDDKEPNPRESTRDVPKPDFPGVSWGPKSSKAKPLPGRQASAATSEVNTHMAAIQSFKCRCGIASGMGSECCLEQLSTYQMRGLHTVIRGPPGGATLPRSEVRARLHAAMWELPRALINPDGSVDIMKRKYRITDWQLTTVDGTKYSVCRSAWIQAMGGNENAHHDMYYFVLRGHSPSDLEADASSKGALDSIINVLDNERKRRGSAKRDHAVSFWVGVMKLCDWMPNDNRLVLRGPGYTFYHHSIYGPRAQALGLALSYKVFMSCRLDALRIVAAGLPGCDAARLSFGRSERHSKFPECTECQERREEFHKALSNPATTPEVLEQKKQRLLEHQTEWTADRAFALVLRRQHFSSRTYALYECDDKCGSWWQSLPVASSGRYTTWCMLL